MEYSYRFEVTMTDILEIRKVYPNNSININWSPEEYWIWLCKVGMYEQLECLLLAAESS